MSELTEEEANDDLDDDMGALEGSFAKLALRIKVGHPTVAHPDDVLALLKMTAVILGMLKRDREIRRGQ